MLFDAISCSMVCYLMFCSDGSEGVGVEGQMTVFYIGSIGGSVIPLLLVLTYCTVTVPLLILQHPVNQQHTFLVSFCLPLFFLSFPNLSFISLLPYLLSSPCPSLSLPPPPLFPLPSLPSLSGEAQSLMRSSHHNIPH